jgi:hypothetical protein
MKRLTCLVALAVVASVMPGAAGADEIDDLARKLALPARWHGYKPDFHFTQQTYTFNESAGPTKRTWRLAMDGPRYVALIPDDHIQLLGFTVGTAPTSFPLPTRYLLDTFRGPALPTQSLIPSFVRYDAGGASNISRSDSFGVGGSTMTLTRASPRSLVEVIKKYVFSVHPQLGYMIEGTTEVTFRRPDPKTKEFTTDIACSGSFQPWANQWVYDKTVLTPAGTTDVQAYANNTAAMAHLAASDPLTLRNGGFVAWLHCQNSWSPCRTFSGLGPDANMTLDPRSNTLHLKIPIPPEVRNDPNGARQVWKLTERLFALPPELTAHLREQAKPAMQAGEGLVLRIGRTEDFEDQPIAFSQPVRGLAWSEPTAPAASAQPARGAAGPEQKNPPKLLTARGASGKKCLLIEGKTQVNVPWFSVTPDIQRIRLRPDSKYTIEAMMKAEDLTTEDRTAYRQAYDDQAGKITLAGRTPPDFEPLAPHGEAYVTAELHASPDGGIAPVSRHKSTVAKADNPAWQKVTLELTTPGYDTYLRVSFICHSGTAMLDDFSLTQTP